MKLGVAQPRRVIDLTRIPDLGEITFQQDGSVRIGAMVSNAALARHAGFAQHFPMVAEALLSGPRGSFAIWRRSRAI